MAAVAPPSVSSPAAPPPVAIAERAEIHKSCRVLEVVVNVLNDYAEAARAVVTLQKKLAKALRDAAVLKATGEIAGNAFSASAGVFEAMCEIDGKFAKIADKECDAVNGEVRKWFKKLAKEEKGHDDKIASVNARIKQAGMSYEKKAKKNTYDAADEHTRYISLLTSLAPEIAQEKYNHQLVVSQRNTTVTYGVAATVARIADAEWLRATEGVRRFAPLIGQVGEWRALCEGGWAAAPPEPLPDLSLGSGPAPPTPQPTPQPSKPSLPNQPSEPPRQPYVVPAEVLATLVPRPAAPAASAAESQPADSPSSPDDARRPMSLANLASFPAPPTHFPLPPVHSPGKPSPSPIERQLTASPTKLEAKLAPQSRSPSLDKQGPPHAESQSDDRYKQPSTQIFSAASASAASATASTAAAPPSLEKRDPDLIRPKSPTKPSSKPDSNLTRAERAAPSSASALASPSSASGSSSSYTSAFRRHDPPDRHRGDYLDDFAPTAASSDRTRSLDSVGTSRRGDGGVERSESVRSSGSVVSQMRDKLGRSTGPASPPPRDVPRLALSVTKIASKFQTPSTAPVQSQDDTPATRRPESRRQSQDESRQDARTYTEQRNVAESPIARRSYDYTEPRPASAYVDDLERRRQRVVELEELERRERNLEERAKKREEARREDAAVSAAISGGLARLREEDETRFDSRRSPLADRRYARSPEPLVQRDSRDGYASDTARPHTVTRPRPLSQASGSLQPPSLSSRYSYSTTSLASSSRSPNTQPFPPHSPIQSHSPMRSYSPTRARSPLPILPSPGRGVPTHPGNCQCPACTVERGGPPVPPPERERKPSGWRRRLSMPVILPFAGDSKKVEKGIMHMHASGKPSIGHQPNSSVTSFGRR